MNEYNNRFSYLREWLKPNFLDGVSLTAWVHKLEIAYQVVKNTYNKRHLSHGTNSDVYHTVDRPEASYANERLIQNRKGLTNKLGGPEEKHTRMILGQIKQEGEYTKRPNQELYRYTEKSQM